MAETSRRRALLYATAEDLRRRSAAEADELGFCPRSLIQANLPYRKVRDSIFERRAGRLHLRLDAPEQVGLPYGRYPRLLLAWVATEAVQTRSRHLDLGSSLSAFLKRLGVGRSGGATGPLRAVRDQMMRLFATGITVTWCEETSFAMERMVIARRSYFWWDQPTDPNLVQPGARVTLSGDFFDELIARPVPIDLRALRALVAPLALDIYCWLSYRAHRLRQPVVIPWSRLQEQFGTQNRHLADFRRHFRKALWSVLVLRPDLRVEAARNDYLLVRPGPRKP